MASLDLFLNNQEVITAYKALKDLGTVSFNDIVKDHAISSIARNLGVGLNVVPRVVEPLPGPIDLRDRHGLLRGMVRPTVDYLRASQGPFLGRDFVAAMNEALEA